MAVVSTNISNINLIDNTSDSNVTLPHSKSGLWGQSDPYISKFLRPLRRSDIPNDIYLFERH
jgi:hypothetical protein